MSPEVQNRPRARRRAPAEKVSAAATRRARERPYRLALAVGLAVSVLLHLLLFLVAGGVGIGHRSVPGPPFRPEAPEGLVVIRYELAPPAPEEEPSARRPEDEEMEAAPPAVRPVREGPGRLPAAEPEAEESRLTNAERLQPRMGDGRLWVDFRNPIRPGSLSRDRYAEAVDRLREVVRVWLDSLQLSEEQRRRALDWTFGEGDSRWGVSPEGLHLGDVTIPIPFGALFQQGGPLGRQAEQAVRDLQEIRDQDVRQEVAETMRERREEMRKRSREEAERRGKDTSGGGG